MSFLVLITAQVLYPNPHELEEKEAQFIETKGFSKAFWLYCLAGAFIAAGFVDFSLIALHFQQTAVVPQTVIPIFYAIAMALGAITALVFGRLYDKKGIIVVLIAFFVAALFAPFVFFGTFWWALFGMILWGLGLGVQESMLKAILTPVLAINKRSTGFGVFDTVFGIAWFVGSAALGLLYDTSIFGLVILSVVLQLLALPVFLMIKSKHL